MPVPLHDVLTRSAITASVKDSVPNGIVGAGVGEAAGRQCAKAGVEEDALVAAGAVDDMFFVAHGVCVWVWGRGDGGIRGGICRWDGEVVWGLFGLDGEW